MTVLYVTIIIAIFVAGFYFAIFCKDFNLQDELDNMDDLDGLEDEVIYGAIEELCQEFPSMSEHNKKFFISKAASILSKEAARVRIEKKEAQK